MKRSVRRPAGCRLPGEAARARTAAVRRVSAGLGAVLLGAGLAAFAPVARGAQDDLVPAGIFRFDASATYETQTTATARDSVIHGMAVYALPETAEAKDVSGTLSREIYETDFQLQLGLTDRWNMSLVVPYVQAIQHSTLRVINPAPADPACNASSTPPCDLTATVANLQSRTVAGMGNYRLTSLHRPIFTDANALTWGLGYSGTLERNTGVYTGVSSLQTRDPYSAFISLIHYTHYPQFARARFDLHEEYMLPIADSVNVPTGQRVSILGAPSFLSSIGWEHEPGSWGYGLRVDQRTTQQSRLDGVAQDDSIKEWIFHAQLGYGNLIELETGPIRFPHQVSLTWDITFFAYNAPMRDRWGLQYFTYF